MKIAVLADEDQWNEINTVKGNVDYFRIDRLENMPAGVDASLLLKEGTAYDFTLIPGPVLINSVFRTLKEIAAPANIVRINGWNSFLSGATWEVAGAINESVEQVFSAMQKKTVHVPDEPGFISARIIVMIINEAYFALEDRISTKEEIDIAMRLGTNYPRGPFEWGSVIGIDKIWALLERLSMDDKRYLPAPLLKKEATA